MEEMKMKPCPICQSEISYTAPLCPHCGHTLWGPRTPEQIQIDNLYRYKLVDENEKLFEKIKDSHDSDLRRFDSYNKLIMFGGIAVFFGIWSLTEKNLSEITRIWSALLMTMSVFVFVMANVVTTLLWNNLLTERYKAIDSYSTDALELQREVQKIEEKYKKLFFLYMKWYSKLKLFWIQLFLAILSTGVLVVGFLIKIVFG